jgi:hypothetical protein
MTIHYHGTPITPVAVFMTMTGKHFCVSHAHPQDVERAHKIGQSVMLDNGAFSSGALGRQPIGLRIMIGLIAGWITRQRGQLYRMKYLATKMRKILLYLNGHMGSEVRQFGICMNL